MPQQENFQERIEYEKLQAKLVHIDNLKMALAAIVNGSPDQLEFEVRRLIDEASAGAEAYDALMDELCTRYFALIEAHRQPL